MTSHHVTFEIEPGLSLIILDTEVRQDTDIRRTHPASAAFTILVSGAIEFMAPSRGFAIPQTVLLSASCRPFEIEARIPKTDSLSSVDLLVEPHWFEQATPALKSDPGFKSLHQIVQHSSKHHIIEQSDDLQRLAKRQLDTLHEADSALSQFNRRAAAYEMLYLLAQNLVSPDPEVYEDDSDLLTKAYSSLRDTPERFDTTEELAAEYGVSGRRLTQGFQRRYGISVASAIRNTRLENAHRLIEAGTPISVSAYKSGYKHASSFSTAFTRHFGYAPRDVKRRCLS